MLVTHRMHLKTVVTSYALAIAVTVCYACARELPPEEKAFFEKAATIGVGAQAEEVKRVLGPPTRTVADSEDCKKDGGDAVWLYETIEANGRRLTLGATVALCVSRDGIVKSQATYMR